MHITRKKLKLEKTFSFIFLNKNDHTVGRADVYYRKDHLFMVADHGTAHLCVLLSFVYNAK